VSALGGLSRRERQINGHPLPAREGVGIGVREAMSSAPGYSAVRAMLRVLEEKGHARHQAKG